MIIVPLQQIETFLAVAKHDTHVEITPLKKTGYFKRIINLYHDGEVFVCQFNTHEVTADKYPLLTKKITHR